MFTYLLTYSYTTLRAQELCESRGVRLCGREATLNANSVKQPHSNLSRFGLAVSERTRDRFRRFDCSVSSNVWLHGQRSSSYTVIAVAVRSLGLGTLSLWLCLSQIMKHSNGSHRCPSDSGFILVVFNCCFTPTETVRNNRY